MKLHELVSLLTKEISKKIQDLPQTGVEFEFLLFSKNLKPKEFNGNKGSKALLQALITEKKWEVLHENENSFKIFSPLGTLGFEPGSQIEFSTSKKTTLFEIFSDFETLKLQLKEFQNALDFRVFSIGLNPLHTLEEIPLLPFQRYQWMLDYFSCAGSGGEAMMKKTCATQICLDEKNEFRLMEKFRTGLWLAPFATALFASSPFLNRKKSELLCTRKEIWNHTDPSRTRLPKEFYLKNQSLENYIEKIINTRSIYYLQNACLKECNEKFCNLSLSPDDFLSAYPEQIRQIYHEVRIRPYLEFRSIDAQIPRFFMAPAAFYKGLFDDDQAFLEMKNLLFEFTYEEISALDSKIAKTAIHTPLRSYTLLDVVKKLLEISSGGLARLRDKNSRSEEIFLHPLMEIVFENHYCPSDFLIRVFEKDCKQDFDLFMNQCEI